MGGAGSPPILFIIKNNEDKGERVTILLMKRYNKLLNYLK